MGCVDVGGASEPLVDDRSGALVGGGGNGVLSVVGLACESGAEVGPLPGEVDLTPFPASGGCVDDVDDLDCCPNSSGRPAGGDGWGAVPTDEVEAWELCWGRLFKLKKEK